MILEMNFLCVEIKFEIVIKVLDLKFDDHVIPTNL